MNNIEVKDIQRIVEAVMSQLPGAAPGGAAGESACLGSVPAEVSARHVHLDSAALEALFGKGYKLTPKRPLSQPGQFLAEERVKLVTEKGEIANVAVLGPLREHTQTELSFTDSRQLGINPPLRLSGDLSGAADVIIVGPKGVYHAKGSVIAAKAHVHMTRQDAASFGVCDGEHICARLDGMRSLTLNDVVVRVSDSSALALHIDYDEANAAMFSGSGSAALLRCGAQPAPAAPIESEQCAAGAEKAQKSGKRRLITEELARDMVSQGLKPTDGDMLTPAAKDIFGASLTGRRG